MNMVRKALGVSVVVALAALMVVSLASAQPGAGGAGGGGGGRGAGGGGGRGAGGGGGMGMGRGVTQESLGATDAEWKVLEPKVTKVQTLNGQLMMGGRGGRGRGAPDAAPAAETDLQKAQTALRALVAPDNTTAKAEDITKALTALRAAREKAEGELTAAQADLKKVVTPKQEALLVLAGLLK
jgi:Spy/CpxP family protein refolding chaperone